MDIQKILDHLDEIVYISDLETNELLYLNQTGRALFGTPTPGVKCHEHLQGKAEPCDFCTNRLLRECQGKCSAWMRHHPKVGNVILHDSVIEYDGRPCRMEIAINVDRYMTELNDAQASLDIERKLLSCVENLVMNNDFTAAVNAMLNTIIEHYEADRAYVYQFDWEHDTTHCTYEVCRENVSPQINNPNTPPVETLVDKFLNQKMKINIIEDANAFKDDPDHHVLYESLCERGVQRLVTVPIFVNGKLHGFLGADNPRSHMDAPELLVQVTYVAANELQRRMLLEKLTDKSYHDPLTGLRNRFAYDELLEYFLGKEIPTGVVFLDLNGLKWINDNMGYDIGNKAIRKVCTILREHFRAEYIYRINGDEFVIIWPEVDYNLFMETAKKLKKALSLEQNIASIGYVWGSEEDIGISVRKAEKAMQTAKNKLYAFDMSQKELRPNYLNSLMQEFQHGTFIPYLQPLYSIQYDRIYGAEVLARQIDTDGNIHTPIEFIDAMEQEHMISMVDFEMLRQACELIREWKAVWPDIVFNINFSRDTLTEPDYLDRVDKILADTGVDPSQLLFEVTESSRGIQLESMSELFDALRKRNISLAIDDFGTEAACLEMLYLPQISVVKIDRSMICRTEQNDREQLVIKRLISLCHDLKMRCVAEGIETSSQLKLLKELGCDCLQGYKIGKPMSPDMFFERFAPSTESADDKI